MRDWPGSSERNIAGATVSLAMTWLLGALITLSLLSNSGCGSTRPTVRPPEARTLPPPPPAPAAESPRVEAPVEPESQPSMAPLRGTERVYPSQDRSNQVAPDAPEAFPVAGADATAVSPPSRTAPSPSAVETRMEAPRADQSSVVTEGFAVQLLASGSRALAEKERDRSIASFSGPVWIEAANRLHKVRVGRCATRAEAESLRAEAVALGFEDAFVIRFVGAKP